LLRRELFPLLCGINSRASFDAAVLDAEAHDGRTITGVNAKLVACQDTSHAQLVQTFYHRLRIA